MASRRSRGIFRPTAPQPYDASSCRGKPFRHSQEFAPSFTTIEFEIIKEYQGDVRKPTWLISETGETYSFEVQRDGLRQEEVEVVVERVESNELGRSGSPCSNGCANQGPGSDRLAGRNGGGGACGMRGISSADVDGDPDLCRDGALLTIFCSRHCERSLLPAPPGTGSFCNSCSSSSIHSSISNPWKFGCRFKLPFDASPERATAAHTVGSLTVTVPRLSWSSPWLRVPHIRWGAWNMQIASAPPQHPALDAADNAARNAPEGVCGSWTGSGCSSGASGSNGWQESQSQRSYKATAGPSAAAGCASACVMDGMASHPQQRAECGGAGSCESSSGETGGTGIWGAARAWGGLGEGESCSSFSSFSQPH
ncbi:unnamed protein product, partial [Closterium sp. NIES-54]